MQKKKSKKSWRKHQHHPCNCYLCSDESWFSRLIEKTRVRNKFFKYPSKQFEE